MRAVISGAYGMAFLLDAPGCASLDVGDGAVPESRPLEDFTRLLGRAPDLEFLTDVNEVEVRRRLAASWEREQALTLFLIMLDSEALPENRALAAEEFEDYAKKPATVEAVENVLYSRPMPAEADPEGAKRAIAAASGGATRTLAFLDKFLNLQPAIARASAAWDRLPGSAFGDTDQAEDRREHAFELLKRVGWFRNASIALHAGGKLNRVRLERLASPWIQRLTWLSSPITIWLQMNRKATGLNRDQKQEPRSKNKSDAKKKDLVKESSNRPKRVNSNAISKSNARADRALIRTPRINNQPVPVAVTYRERIGFNKRDPRQVNKYILKRYINNPKSGKAIMVRRRRMAEYSSERTSPIEITVRLKGYSAMPSIGSTFIAQDGIEIIRVRGSVVDLRDSMPTTLLYSVVKNTRTTLHGKKATYLIKRDRGKSTTRKQYK